MNQAEKQRFWEQAEEVYVRQMTKALMGDALKEGRQEGRKEGRKAAVLEILESRRLVPSEQQRARIEANEDDVTVDLWIRRAAVIDRVDDLF